MNCKLIFVLIAITFSSWDSSFKSSREIAEFENFKECEEAMTVANSAREHGSNSSKFICARKGIDNGKD